jgi:hypothetical protein
MTPFEFELDKLLRSVHVKAPCVCKKDKVFDPLCSQLRRDLQSLVGDGTNRSTAQKIADAHTHESVGKSVIDDIGD